MNNNGFLQRWRIPKYKQQVGSCSRQKNLATTSEKKRRKQLKSKLNG